MEIHSGCVNYRVYNRCPEQNGIDATATLRQIPGPASRVRRLPSIRVYLKGIACSRLKGLGINWRTVDSNEKSVRYRERFRKGS